MHDKYKIAISIIIVILFVVGTCYYVDASRTENTISIGVLHTDHDAPAEIAEAQGLYKKEGLNVEIRQFNNGGDLMTAMASGDIDIGYLGISPVLSTYSKGAPVKIVSAVQTGGSSLVVRANENISSIEDLNGKTVATIGETSIQYILLTKYMKENGMNINDIKHIAMKSSTMTGALGANQLDAMFVPEPYASVAVAAGVGKILVSSEEVMPNHPCCVIATSDSFIKTHPNELKKILAIHEKATNFVNENPDKAVKILPRDMVIDENVQKNTLSQLNFISGLSPEFKQSVLDFATLEVKLGFLNTTIDSSKLFYDI